jgi:predicted glycoside hydrolase/deacetylase ChbG (UPF0249 family)
MPRMRIVTRGDDSGSCHSANIAIADAFKKGILRNTSIMVPAPLFREATQMYRDMDGFCIGLHATITDEWNTDRWGPVLGAATVPSIVKPDGTFFENTQQVWQNNPDYDEILAEIKAQLDLARSEGLDIKYMDTHMGFNWFEGLEARLSEFAKLEELIYRPEGLSRLTRVEGEFSDPVERLLATLDEAETGKTYMVVGHPCYDTGDIQPMTYGDHLPGEIAKDRDWERRLFMDDRVMKYFSEEDIQPIAFTEIA